MDKLPEISEDLNRSLLSIKNITNSLDTGDGTISKLINSDEFYTNINGLITDSRSLLEDVKKNPTKYLRAYFEAKKK